MSIVEKNISVSLAHEHLADTPEYSTPDGYAIRAYCPGDEHLWLEIESAAERYITITAELFLNEFGDDPRVLAERQLFLIDPQGKAIGTATAWFDDDYHGQRYGRIHWVAIHPSYQGRGLSKPLLSAACSRLRALGHDRAYLVTATGRISAINLYLHFGFTPEIRGAEDASVWAEMKGHLKGLADYK
ncbi:MAG: GNAT family N-acetyltransferase [Lentisphaerales bacterium]|nr:MAG: GNAT family N-acetyltransferase [Lentisphaerales bacterium]